MGDTKEKPLKLRMCEICQQTSYIEDIKKRADVVRKDAKASIESMVASIFRKENEAIKEELKLLYPIAKAVSDTVLKFDKAYEDKKREKGI